MSKNIIIEKLFYKIEGRFLQTKIISNTTDSCSVQKKIETGKIPSFRKFLSLNMGKIDFFKKSCIKK